MKCWKCGGHMTKYGVSAVCDSCGRTVYPKSHSNQTNSPPSLSNSLGLLGIGTLALLATKKLDETTEQKNSNKGANHFSIRKLVRGFFCYAVSFLLIIAGLCGIVYGFELPSTAGMTSMLTVASSLLIIWGGILVAFLRGKERLSFGIILGSVAANILCKILSLILIFSDIAFIHNMNFAIRLVVGGVLLILSHLIYKRMAKANR
ncbi:MAG: hypothetical protein IJX84_00755 [Clostridia bacterium]|nr:hypothetical protein [Clostridia bacterium]